MVMKYKLVCGQLSVWSLGIGMGWFRIQLRNLPVDRGARSNVIMRRNDGRWIRKSEETWLVYYHLDVIHYARAHRGHVTIDVYPNVPALFTWMEQ